MWIVNFTWRKVVQNWPEAHIFADEQPYAARAFAIVTVPWEFVYLILPSENGKQRPKYTKITTEGVWKTFMQHQGSRSRLEEIRSSGYGEDLETGLSPLPCGVVHPRGFYIVDGRHRSLTMLSQTSVNKNAGLRAYLVI